MGSASRSCATSTCVVGSIHHAYRSGAEHRFLTAEDLLALIHAHRPVVAVPDDPPPPGTETSIVAALRARLTAKDTQIAELRAALRERDRTIATLHGELHKLTELRPASAAVIADDPRAR